MDAEFLKDILVQEGLRAVVQGQALESGAFGTLPLSAQSGPTVWVADEDESKAAGIVDEYRRVDRASADDASVARSTWKCANCGEQVESQFTQCWKCGHQRPAEGTVVEPVDGPH